MKYIKIMLVMMIISFVVAGLWNSLPFVKNLVHAALDPTAGALLHWHSSYGMLIIAFIFTLITTLLQKYTTDQAEIKRLKEEQKALQEKMKSVKDNPEKMMEYQREMMEISFNKMMPLTMKPIFYTIIPFILFFRWFSDYFLLTGDKVFGMSWFLGYIVLSIIVSIILRKIFNVH